VSELKNRVIQLQYALLREIEKYAALVPERDEEADWDGCIWQARRGWVG
jgi:hypothetical protein